MSSRSTARSGAAKLLAPIAIVIILGVAVAIYWRVFREKGNPGPIEPVAADGKKPAPPAGPAWFRDMTTDSGLEFSYRNGEEANHYAILESLGGGVALLDYDGDGLLDIFVPGGGYFVGTDIRGHPSKLFRNRGQWKFQDVTQETGLGLSWWYTHGAAVADYDRDGWPDLLVTGYGKIELFHNETGENGGRRFRAVAEALGLRDASWSTSAGWGDLDGDGFPDLYVCHYVDWSFANHPKCPGNSQAVERDICNPEAFKPLMHSLFRNDKGKGFRDVAGEQGFQAAGCGLGVVWADLNDDARPDIYVANDTNNKFLFFNRGGKLEEKARLSSAAADENGKPDGSMGVDVGDYDGVGRASLWVTNFQNEVHALYQNRGNELFYHQSRAGGIAALSRQFVGFGTSLTDFDNDGWEDIAFVNGHVWRHPAVGSPRQRPVLLRNLDAGQRRFFKDISPEGGSIFQTPARGRGLSVGDLDNDGWPDLTVSHVNGPVVLLRNECGSDSANRWLGIELSGVDHRSLVGSTVVLETETRQQTRFVKGGGSYLSASDPRILFGLPPGETIRGITVKWAWGQSQTWEGLEPNAYWQLRENTKTASRWRARTR